MLKIEKIFNQNICRTLKLLEYGIFNRLKKKWQPYSENTMDSKLQPIVFDQISLILILLIFGCLVSIVIFILELGRKKIHCNISID